MSATGKVTKTSSAKRVLDYAEIVVWFTAGCPVHTVYGLLNMTEKEWYSRMKVDRQLRDAYTQGKAKCEFNLALLLQNSRSPHVLIFRAKAVLGLRETPQAIELSGPAGQPIKSEVRNDATEAFVNATALLDRLTEAARNRDEPASSVAGDSAAEADSPEG